MKHALANKKIGLLKGKRKFKIGILNSPIYYKAQKQY